MLINEKHTLYIKHRIMISMNIVGDALQSI